MAIECFLPLANKGYVKAQHNLAMRYLDLNNEIEAYKWFQRASEQGFEPSNNNLNKMNLLLFLLPNEVLSKIASHLNMKDLLNFKLSSTRINRAADKLLTYTNFLDSKAPFVNYISTLLINVEFEPQPKSIRLVKFVRALDSSIEIRFRDHQHLKSIVEQTPLIHAKEKIYFVHDKNVEDSKELAPLQGKMTRGYFIHIEADCSLKIKGQLQTSLMVILPRGSDFNGLIYEGKGICTGGLAEYQNALNLINVIDSFNEDLYRIRSSDAYTLLENRRKSGLRDPEKYPAFKELCPTALLLSGSEIKILLKDYIHSENPLIYIAKSIPEIEELRVDLPEFMQAINFIDPECKFSGVYSKGPLDLVKGFEISTDAHLTILGKMILPDYNVSINAKKDLWIFGYILKAQNISLKSKNYYDGPLYPVMTREMKPQNMPEEEWSRLIQAGREYNLFQSPNNL